ncbi:MAG: shikimate dehydrogenase [Verrucomicrobiae bacterium]|nr:shikimate dehydrogenase [Verrucomicrobiae bacterium]
MYFIGVTTAQSSINPVFPKWAEALGLDNAALLGIDFAVHDEPHHYREAVAFIKAHPMAMGALVTTHKIDLFNAAEDLFDAMDPLSRSMGEISSIYKRDGKLYGRTVDPMNGGKALNALLPKDYWKADQTSPAACILGAGGAGIALSWFLMQSGRDHPKRIMISDRDPAKLEQMKRFHAALESESVLEYHYCPKPVDNDALVAQSPPGSLIVNATGLGKDAPGSPLTGAVQFPPGAIAWDLNYRGQLVFLDQARSQPHVRAVDGWQYFIYGWSSVIADVFDLEIADGSEELAELSRLAIDCRT